LGPFHHPRSKKNQGWRYLGRLDLFPHKEQIQVEQRGEKLAGVKITYFKKFGNIILQANH